MRISIVDKQIKYVLNLSSEELVHLMRLQPTQGRRSPFQIASPVLLVCGDEKHEVDVIDIDESRSERRGVFDYDEQIEMNKAIESKFGTVTDVEISTSPSPKKRRKKVDPTESIPSFVLTTELTSALFKTITENNVILLLVRIQNIPAYALIKTVRIDALKPGTPGNLILEIERVKPIVDLLKAQLTESSFYETFIVGKSEEFFESGGEALNDLVAIVGILRKENESDNELRIRVKSYLKIRIAETTDVDDQEIKALIKKAEEVAEIERLMEEAREKKKSTKEKDK